MSEPGTDSHNHRRLIEHLLPMSAADTWDRAIREWYPGGVWRSERDEACPCGHYPIRELCEIVNDVTGNRTAVGNVCIRRFEYGRFDLIAKNMRRITVDREAALTTDAIQHFHRIRVIDDYERKFCEDTMRKRNLTARQATMRRRINMKVRKFNADTAVRYATPGSRQGDTDE